MSKRFAWSWSKLKNYRSCPKRHFHVDIEKSFKEDQSDALLWGNQVHDALAKRVEKRVALPPTMQNYEGWPSRITALADAGITLKVENKLAIDDQFKPTGFFAGETWFRGVIDVLGLLPPETKAAFTIDWKTGNKVQPEFEQLALSAQTVFAHYPNVDAVLAVYVWLGHDTQSVKIYERSQMAGIWADIMPEVRKMAEAHRTTTYPPTPSGLCIRYCPVTACPYHGKGGR